MTRMMTTRRRLLGQRCCITRTMATSLITLLVACALTVMADEVPLPSEPAYPVDQHFGAGYLWMDATGDVARVDHYAIDGSGFLGIFDGLDPSPVFVQTPYSGATSITFSPDGTQLIIGTDQDIYLGHLEGGQWVEDASVLLDTFGLQSMDLYGGRVIGSFTDGGLRQINPDGTTVTQTDRF